MARHTTDAVFTLTVTGMEHGEWQGLLQSGTEELSFQSVMELLKEIQAEIERKKQ